MPGHLLDSNDHELSRLQGCEAHQDVDNAKIDVILGSGLLVALGEICFPRCLAREGALAKQVLHESAHIQVDLCPEQLVVWLKHRPFGGTVNTFCDVKEQSSDRDVLVSAAEVVVPIHITGAGAG